MGVSAHICRNQILKELNTAAWDTEQNLGLLTNINTRPSQSKAIRINFADAALLA
jgi:hypothetical protein